MSNMTVQLQSNCGEPSGDDLLACYSGVTPGSTVTYYCANSSLTGIFRCASRACLSNSTWSGATPTCVCNGKLSTWSDHTSVVRKSHSHEANTTWRKQTWCILGWSWQRTEISDALQDFDVIIAAISYTVVSRYFRITDGSLNCSLGYSFHYSAWDTNLHIELHIEFY